MKTVIFDVDDTLYDQLQPFRLTVQKRLHNAFPNDMIEVLYKTSRKYSDEVFEKHMSGEITALELQTYRMIKACQDFNISLSYEEAVAFQDTYLREQRKIQLFDPMKRVIEELAQLDVQLAILTNGELEHQMMKIKQLGLSKWIPEDHFFVSGDIGHSKPSLEIFEHIEQQLQLDKTQTLYIGDSFEHDIVGAHGAGWKSIWFNHRKRQPTSLDIHADYTVIKPGDIIPIMSQMVEVNSGSETS